MQLIPSTLPFPTSLPGAYTLEGTAAGALAWVKTANTKGPTPFVNALAPEFNVSNSTVTTDGTINSGTPNLVVADSSSWRVGQGIYVIGAGAAGAVLETTVSAIPSSTAITLAANAATTVSSGTNNVGHSDTAGIQAALDFAVSANVGSAGKVVLPPGIYNVSGINIPHECWLVGSGQRNTLLQSIPGATALGVVIMNGTSKGCGLFDLGINGNKGATPAPAGSGIYITSTLTAGLRDHRIENVTIDDAVLDGVEMTAPGPEMVINCYFRNVVTVSAGRHGFNLATNYVTDSFFVTCYAALSGSNGFNILGATTMFIGCEADDSTADGWVFSGSGCVGNILSGCRSGNNLGHSVFFTGSNKTNTVDLFSYDPRADHVNIAGGTDNHIRVTAVAPFATTNSDSMLDAGGGSGNVCHLTWPASAIASTALTGAALASQIIIQNGAYYGASDLTLLDGADLVLGTSTGTKIGTATSQKLGFFNATPIVQNTSTEDLRTGLINLGFFASGGASPLNLNGGTLTSGGLFVSGNTASITPTGSTAELHGADTAQTTLAINAYGSNAAIDQLRTQGTAASPTAVTSGLALGVNNFGGYNGSAIVRNAARIRAFAAQTWSGSINSTYFQIETVATGASGAASVRLKIDENGLTLTDAHNIITGTTTGMKIGTATTQKLGFWNATPVVRGAAWTPTNVTTDRAFDANATTLDEVADALGTLIAELQTMGLLS